MVDSTMSAGVRRGDDSSGESQRELAEVRIGTVDGAFTLTTDAVAVEDTGVYRVKILSAAGAATHIKALAAILQSDVRCEIRVNAPGFQTFVDCYKSEGGYRVYKARLDYNTWQAVAIAKTPGLLACISEEAVWQALQRSDFTTPMLRSWMPYLMTVLADRNYLKPLKSFGCKAGIIMATTEKLDEIVSEGLKLRRISI